MQKTILLMVIQSSQLEPPEAEEAKLWVNWIRHISRLLPVVQETPYLEPYLLEMLEKTAFLSIPQWPEPVHAAWIDVLDELPDDMPDSMKQLWHRRFLSDIAGIERSTGRHKFYTKVRLYAEQYPKIIERWPQEQYPWDAGVDNQYAHTMVTPVDNVLEFLGIPEIPDYIPVRALETKARLSGFKDPRLAPGAMLEGMFQLGLPRSVILSSKRTVDPHFLLTV